jgi:hypothetical protein
MNRKVRRANFEGGPDSWYFGFIACGSIIFEARGVVLRIHVLVFYLNVYLDLTFTIIGLMIICRGALVKGT